MSLVYLDTVIAIYSVEGLPPFRNLAQARLGAMIASGAQGAFSDLTRLECRIKPLALQDASLLQSFELFFTGLILVPLTSRVYDRAAQIRADYRFKLGDALHLAAAVEAGCDRFLTNDGDLARFPDLVVEVLS